MPRMTQAELNAYEARRRSVRAADDAEDSRRLGCSDESDLHDQIMAECRRRGWLVFHGSMAHATRRTEGEPDFVVVGTQTADVAGLPALIPQVWFIEAKTKTGKLSPAQQAVHAHARKLGHTIHVVRSFDEFLKLL